MRLTANASKAPRVLLVDDDSISLELTALLLAANGALVERALGGQQALDLLHNHSPLPDTVLVDLQMPGISGADIARFVQSLPSPRPRVIAMSAAALPEAERGIFDHALLKPLDRELLRAALAGPRNGDGAMAANAPPVLSFVRTPALDQVRIRKLQEIMPPEAIAELYGVYVADTRNRIAELEHCSASGDEEGLRRCAHAIKGSSAMIGVPGMASIAAGFESGHTSQQECSKLFLEMRSTCDDVERSMARASAPGEIE